jgi:hypothetical protein
MVKIIDEIPTKEAEQYKIPRSRPEINGIPGEETIRFKRLILPRTFNRTLLNRSNVDVRPRGFYLGLESVKDRIQETAREKDMYLRFAGDKPLSLVTGQFKEIDARKIAQEVGTKLGTNPIVRYFRNDESVQLNFPIQSRFPGLNLMVNTGPYGVYGGSGQNAVKYGISWYNNVCSNWTMFLGKELMQRKGRIVHRNGGQEGSIDALSSCVDDLVGAIDESKVKFLDRSTLENYFEMYEPKGIPKKMAEQILKEKPVGTSAYDLSYRLTQLCQNDKLSDVTRAKVEYVAGEVILCYDKIMQGITDAVAGQIIAGQAFACQRRTSGTRQFGQLYYVAK